MYGTNKKITKEIFCIRVVRYLREAERKRAKYRQAITSYTSRIKELF